jgi:DNA mismatch repair ATPase MutL
MQAYALARPAVQFRLHVLKAKNDKSDFVYAPKSNANVEDAVLKVIGRDCALQCDWTALETDGFEVHAFLPKPTAKATKIASQGAFISIDSRPVSNSRGTIKQVVAAFRERLRKSNSSFANVKDPFFTMNIVCPPDSYDPNIEPAKDDVMFDNGDVVLGAVDKLLMSYYPKAITYEIDEQELPMPEQEEQARSLMEMPVRNQTSLSIYEDPSEEDAEDYRFRLQASPASWRSSMYGIDEKDLEFLQENQPPVVEEEEGSGAAAVSNPWTIARMNAATKSNKPATNGQLLSPAKSDGEVSMRPSSPAPFGTPRRVASVTPLTPQTSSQMNIRPSLLDKALEESIQHLPQRKSPEQPSNTQAAVMSDRLRQSIIASSEAFPFSSSDLSSVLRRAVLTAADRLVKNRFESGNNTDIREFFGQPDRERAMVAAGSSFTAINAPPRSQFPSGTDTTNSRASSAEPHPRSKRIHDQMMLHSDNGATSQSRNMANQFRAYAERERPSSQPLSSTLSSTSFRTRSQHDRDAMRLHDDNGAGGTRNMTRAFQAYENSISNPRPFSADGQRLPIRPDDERSAMAHSQHIRRSKNNLDTQANQSRSLGPPSPTHPPPSRRSMSRTKSSMLPLERILLSHRIQNLVLCLRVSLITITQQILEVDMRGNSVEWGCSAEGAYDVFAEKEVRVWVDRVYGVVGKSSLREVIEIRGEEDEEGRGGDVQVATPVMGGGEVTNDVPSNFNTAPNGDEMADFDSSQFVDMDDEVSVANAAAKVDDEFGDDIEDEMLMDI